MAGAVAFPVVVPLLMVRVSVAAGVMAAVLVGTDLDRRDAANR